MTCQAEEKFEKIIASQLARIERMKNEGDFIDYTALSTIVIGI